MNRKQTIRLLRSILATSLRRFLRRSDYSRWRGTEALSEQWDERTRLVAGMIPAQSSVLELGAGRLRLREYLAAGCRYTPSDFVDRGPGTILWDLNAHEWPDLGIYDVAVFSGVLEYVHDVRRLVSFLGSHVQTIVASYSVFRKGDRAYRRRSLGWVNDHSQNELVAIFAEAGFECEAVKSWRDQPVFLFRNRLVFPDSSVASRSSEPGIVERQEI